MQKIEYWKELLVKYEKCWPVRAQVDHFSNEQARDTSRLDTGAASGKDARLINHGGLE